MAMLAAGAPPARGGELNAKVYQQIVRQTLRPRTIASDMVELKAMIISSDPNEIRRAKKTQTHGATSPTASPIRTQPSSPPSDANGVMPTKVDEGSDEAFITAHFGGVARARGKLPAVDSLKASLKEYEFIAAYLKAHRIAACGEAQVRRVEEGLQRIALSSSTKGSFDVYDCRSRRAPSARGRGARPSSPSPACGTRRRTPCCRRPPHPRSRSACPLRGGDGTAAGVYSSTMSTRTSSNAGMAPPPPTRPTSSDGFEGAAPMRSPDSAFCGGDAKVAVLVLLQPEGDCRRVEVARPWRRREEKFAHRAADRRLSAVLRRRRRMCEARRLEFSDRDRDWRACCGSRRRRRRVVAERLRPAKFAPAESDEPATASALEASSAGAFEPHRVARGPQCRRPGRGQEVAPPVGEEAQPRAARRRSRRRRSSTLVRMHAKARAARLAADAAAEEEAQCTTTTEKKKSR